MIKDFVKKYWVLLLLGFLLRLIIAGIAYHPDVRILDFTSKVILEEHNLDPYDFKSKLTDSAKKRVYSIEEPDDLPLQYWINIPMDLIIRPLVISKLEDQFLTDPVPLFGTIFLSLHLIYIKLPLIFFDLLTGVFLALSLPVTLRKKGLIFWLFNPVTLWATAAVGQVDIMPTFFVVLAYYFLQKDRLQLSAFSLGVGAALKSFPFLLAPFLIFMVKSWRERITLGFLIFWPWLMSVLPYILSSGFRRNALFAPQLDKIFYFQFGLSGGESIYMNIFILTVLYLVFLSKKRLAEDFFNFSAAALILLLAFTHFHMQWFLWVTPFLTIYLVKGVSEVSKMAFIVLGLGLLMMLFLFEAPLHARLLAPLIPVSADFNGLKEILYAPTAEFFRSIAATLFAAAAVVLVFAEILKNNLPFRLKNED